MSLRFGHTAMAKCSESLAFISIYSQKSLRVFSHFTSSYSRHFVVTFRASHELIVCCTKFLWNIWSWIITFWHKNPPSLCIIPYVVVFTTLVRSVSRTWNTLFPSLLRLAEKLEELGLGELMNDTAYSMGRQ